jgi:hypothetical protein
LKKATTLQKKNAEASRDEQKVRSMEEMVGVDDVQRKGMEALHH